MTDEEQPYIAGHVEIRGKSGYVKAGYETCLELGAWVFTGTLEHGWSITAPVQNSIEMLIDAPYRKRLFLTIVKKEAIFEGIESIEVVDGVATIQGKGAPTYR